VGFSIVSDRNARAPNVQYRRIVKDSQATGIEMAFFEPSAAFCQLIVWPSKESSVGRASVNFPERAKELIPEVIYTSMGVVLAIYKHLINHAFCG
jgi:hypothetical protein